MIVTAPPRHRVTVIPIFSHQFLTRIIQRLSWGKKLQISVSVISSPRCQGLSDTRHIAFKSLWRHQSAGKQLARHTMRRTVAFVSGLVSFSVPGFRRIPWVVLVESMV